MNIDLLKQQPLFRSLTDRELELMAAITQELHLPSNEVFIQEGENISQLYLIVQGQASVVKQHTNKFIEMATLEKFDIIGEINFFQKQHASASIKTTEDTQLLLIDIHILETEPEYSNIYHKIASRLGHSLSMRLRNTSSSMASSSHAHAQEQRMRLSMLGFMLLVLYSFSFYTLTLSKSFELSQESIHSTFITIVMIALFTSITLLFIKKSGFPLRDFGLTTKDGMHSLRESFFYTAIFIAIITLAKWLILMFGDFPEQPVFNYMQQVNFVKEKYPETYVEMYILTTIIYLIFCPLQEMVNRGGIQSCLDKFINFGRKKPSFWSPIIVTNLVFVAGHAHVDIGLAIAVFIPGVFWGWLYARQRTLIGVSVSHILLGGWGFFIIGYIA